jgi:integrase/recombinase XerD
MDALIESYLARLKRKGCSPHTIRAYASDLREARQALGKPLETVKPRELERFIETLASSGLKGTSVRRKQASLRGFFEHARREGAIVGDPTERFEPPKTEQRLPKYLSDHQVEQLLGALRTGTIEERREAALVLCLYYTGMRAGELVGLDWEHVTPAGIRVFGKGQKERMAWLDPRLAEVLELWREVSPTGGRGPVFVGLTPPHRRITYKTANTIFQAVLTRAGLAGQGLSMHSLRHTFATRMIRKVSIDKVQKALGHKRLDTTTIYAHTELGNDFGEALRSAL